MVRLRLFDEIDFYYLRATNANPYAYNINAKLGDYRLN